ncbi:MAG: STAS domain-containing protein [Deltaproteobacteria bacterium]|nr:STAS domain-containing protein [Deltaproteobacteria bacterium]
MEYGLSLAASAMHVLNGNLIVTVNGELDDDSAKQLQRDILSKTEVTSVKGVLIDVSSVRFMDSFTFSLLADTARMVSLLGARPVFVGFKAGVASALVDLEVNLDSISTALTMEDGVELLNSYKPRWIRLDDIGVNGIGVDEAEADLGDAEENDAQDDAEVEEEGADHGDAEGNDQQDDR